MFDNQLLLDSMPLLMRGMLSTIALSIACITLSLTLGMILGLLQAERARNKLSSTVIDFYISYVRGVPYYIQLLLMYFVFPEITGLELSPLAAGIISLGLCSAGHSAEIIRGGIRSIPETQWEAAIALGYPTGATLRQIIIPQMFYYSVPALINEFIGVVKSTSMLSAIGILEITKIGQNIIAREMDPMTIYLAIAVIYYLFIMLIAAAGRRFEKTYSFIK